MKKDNKKALYESIMTSVAKEVKRVLNESASNQLIHMAELYADDICDYIVDYCKYDMDDPNEFINWGDGGMDEDVSEALMSGSSSCANKFKLMADVADKTYERYVKEIDYENGTVHDAEQIYNEVLNELKDTYKNDNSEIKNFGPLFEKILNGAIHYNDSFYEWLLEKAEDAGRQSDFETLILEILWNCYCND